MKLHNDYRKDKTILESGLSAVLTHYQQLPSVLFIPNIVRLIYHPSRLYGKIKTSIQGLSTAPVLTGVYRI